MDLSSLVEKNRSYRRFFQNETVDTDVLTELVGLAGITPSAANRQPLKYILSNTPGMNGKIFSTLGWAAFLSDWPGPEEGERPPAYIVILGDTGISRDWSADPGLQCRPCSSGLWKRGSAAVFSDR